jgi:phosphoribosylglycinamide formyltransferase-1
MPPQTRTPIVVLVSGRGSNLQAIIDAAQQDLPVTIAAVISNDAKAFALERARRAELPTHIVDHRAFPTRADFEAALRTRIDQHTPALVVLAGFMRLLSSAFVSHYQGRMINIHPSLLPQFRGLNTHQRALAAGCQEHGASVHFVTEEVDAGPIIIQARVPVLPDDTPEALANRVLECEHRILPQAIRWFVQGRLTLRENDVLIDGEPALAHGRD